MLDESQVVDRRLTGKFPSRKYPNDDSYRRSLLSPMIEGLELGAYDCKVILCGTGLDVASAYDTARSSSVRGVQPGCFGIGTFYNAAGVANMLQWAGVTDRAPQYVLERFAGRPRDSASLAQWFLEKGEVSGAEAENVATQRRKAYNQMFGRLYEKRADPGSALVRTTGTLKDKAHKSVGAYARERALDFAFGGDGKILDEYLVNLMEIGVCSLKRQSGGGNVAVIAEPLVIEALSDFAGVEFEETIEAASLGNHFERYVVWHMETIAEFINAELERVKERGELGHGAASAVSSSSSSARSKRRRTDDEGGSSATAAAAGGADEGGSATAAAAGGAASLLASYFGPWRLGSREVDARRASKALDGDEGGLVKGIMARGSSQAVFPGTKMGPDVIFVLYAPAAEAAASSSSSSAAASSSSSSASSSSPRASKLVVLVQCRSGKHKSTPDALRTLQDLYAELRTAKSSGTIPRQLQPAAEAFGALFKDPDTLLARLVIKPKAASQGEFPRVDGGALELVIDKSNKEGFVLKSMKAGFENIDRVRGGGEGGGGSRSRAAKKQDLMSEAAPQQGGGG